MVFTPILSSFFLLTWYQSQSPRVRVWFPLVRPLRVDDLLLRLPRTPAGSPPTRAPPTASLTRLHRTLRRPSSTCGGTRATSSTCSDPPPPATAPAPPPPPVPALLHLRRHPCRLLPLFRPPRRHSTTCSGARAASSTLPRLSRPAPVLLHPSSASPAPAGPPAASPLAARPPSPLWLLPRAASAPVRPS